MSRLSMLGAGPSGPGASAYPATILAEGGLVSYWRLQETSGTSAADSKGTNTGTYVNTPTLAQGGPLSNDTSVLFTAASTQCVQAAVSTTVINNFALELWVKLAAVANQDAMFTHNGNGPANGWGIGMNDGTGGAAGLKLTGLIGGVAFVDSGYTFADTNWHHVVMTREAGTMKFYVDGAATANTSATAPNAPATAYRIACDYFNGPDSKFFNGSLAEVAVYNSALTAATVAAHYAAR